MRSARWLLLVAVVAIGALILFLMLKRDSSLAILPEHGIYPAGSKIPDKQAPGGFGKSSNLPKNLADKNWGEAGTISLVVFPDERTASGKGFVVRLVNRTDAVVGFTACDSCLYLAQEALDRSGNWRPIELPPIVICGNSFHRVFLDRNQYWEFSARRYSGVFKTRLRFRLEQGELRPLDLDDAEGGGERTFMLANRGGRIIHSNEFDGWINETQFVSEDDR